jgi:meromycolic acid enoyl-[acyl-carrier-protein] reductase
MRILEGKRYVVTGVLTKDSIAFATAERIQELGGEIVLTSFGRARRLTDRAAKNLAGPPDILELDVTKPDDFQALAEDLRERWGAVDGALHAIANAPADALGGGFLDADAELALQALRVSAVSFRDLAMALRPLMRSAGGGSVVGLDFDASVAWPQYDWMGVSKAALESVCRYCARDLGGDGIRANLVSAGPVHTPAASAFDHFDRLSTDWTSLAPLGWDAHDTSPIAEAVCFLLSDMSRAITGEILHVDGGVHAVGAAGATDDGKSGDGATELGSTAQREKQQ